MRAGVSAAEGHAHVHGEIEKIYSPLGNSYEMVLRYQEMRNHFRRSPRGEVLKELEAARQNTMRFLPNVVVRKTTLRRVRTSLQITSACGCGNRRAWTGDWCLAMPIFTLSGERSGALRGRVYAKASEMSGYLAVTGN